MGRCAIAMVMAGLLTVSLMAQLPVTNNLVVWLDASDTDSVVLDKDAGYVARWENLATGDDSKVFGGERISAFAMQAFAPGRPMPVTLPNGTQAIRFDKSVLRADKPGSALGDSALQNWTFFFVLANTANTQALFDSAPGAGGPIRFLNKSQVSRQGDDDNGGGGIPVVLPTDTSGGVIFSFSFGTVGGTPEWNGYIDGGGYAGSSSTEGRVGVTWGTPQLGTINAGHNEVYFSGDIAEVIIYNRVLDSAEQLAVTEYLGEKYGVTLVPEPATMSVLAMGGLALLRRRK